MEDFLCNLVVSKLMGVFYGHLLNRAHHLTHIELNSKWLLKIWCTTMDSCLHLFCIVWNKIGQLYDNITLDITHFKSAALPMNRYYSKTVRAFKWDAVHLCGSRGCKTIGDQSLRSEKIGLYPLFSYDNCVLGHVLPSSFI